jgi:fucose permease
MPRPAPSLLPYFATFVVLGVGTTVLGPAVATLRTQTGATLSTIAAAFTAQSVGYLIASVLAGRRYDRGAGHRLLAGGLAVLGLGSLGWAPASSVGIVVVVAAVVGVGAAVVDVGANTLLVWSRPGNPGPGLNALHLSFGVGALAAPAVVGVSTARTGGLWGAVIVVAVPAAVMAAVVLGRRAPDPASAPGAAAPRAGTRPRVGLAVFYVLYIGAELGMAGWLPTYAEGVGVSATGVTTVFWAGFCLGRLTAIAVVRRLGDERLLFVCCGLATASAALLAVGDGAAAALWVGAGAFGATVAPQFPTMVAVADRRLGLTGSVTSWIMAGTGIGSLSLPWLIGVLLDRVGVRAMPLTVLGLSIATIGWMAVLTARLLPTRELQPGRPAVISPS